MEMKIFSTCGPYRQTSYCAKIIITCCSSLVVDDLRINLGAYSDHTDQKSISQTKIHTPHIDALAKRGVIFDRVQLLTFSIRITYNFDEPHFTSAFM